MIKGAATGTVPSSARFAPRDLDSRRDSNWGRSTDPLLAARFDQIVFTGGNDITLFPGRGADRSGARWTRLSLGYEGVMEAETCGAAIATIVFAHVTIRIFEHHVVLASQHRTWWCASWRLCGHGRGYGQRIDLVGQLRLGPLPQA
jgi:hypothetical protein